MPRHDYASSPGGTLRNKLTGQCKGVTKSGSKYRAKVWCTEQGKYKNLGSFDSEHEAAASVASAEASGTQYLPSPRQYVRRKNTLAYGARLTRGSIVCAYCIVQHRRATSLCSSGSNASSSRSNGRCSCSSRSLLHPPSRLSTRSSKRRWSSTRRRVRSGVVCCLSSPDMALQGRPRLRVQRARCVRGLCRPACVLHVSLRLRFDERRRERGGSVTDK